MVAFPARMKPENKKWTRVALLLVGVTVGYNFIEALVAIWAGVKAGSIALMGFGLDSVIELAASGVLFWRLKVQGKGENQARVEQLDRRVHRFVGLTFLALAGYVIFQSLWTLISKNIPQESLVGIVLALASLIVMPLVAWGKLRAAAHLGSKALQAEAKETLACSYLSLVLLIGLAANAWAGIPWADPVAALLMVPWLLKEGREGLRGEEGD